MKLSTCATWGLVVALVACQLRYPPGPAPVSPDDPAPVVVVEPGTAATYVYEKDDTAITAPVAAGLNRLNREKKIIATLFEDDTRDGAGEVPDQYKVPLAEAQKAGLPALIVTAGEKVVNVVKDPKTEAEIWGALP